MGQAYDYWQDQPGILFRAVVVATAPIDLPEEASESVYIGELTARLGGYALTSITVLILDIFPQIQLKTYNVCFKRTYAASHQTGETNLTADILAIESKHRMLDPQADDCRLTPFPRTVDIWHPINPHLYALAIRSRSKTSCFY